MKTTQHFDQICRAMAEPAFYPHSVSRVERRDTHISSVFLTGRWVYKLKKPVDFGFLDFTGLDARRHFCEQEVRLNQRLSHDVYVGVVRICREDDGRLSLDGNGEVVEYAVKMRQLPDEASLRELLQRGRVSHADMERLGEHLAAFYERSERSSDIEHYGHREVIAVNMEENFRQVEPFVGDMVPREPWDFIRQVSRAFFQNWSALFDRRVETGRIRDGHGDLRTDHVYFFEGVQIIDCIEFSDRFRYGDVIVDLAYLHMDLEHSGHSELSRAMLTAYVEKAADPELYTLLDFYATYRAIVKVKLACLNSEGAENEAHRAVFKEQAREYLSEAFRYGLQFSRPTLWVFCGLPATGKSALASQMADALSLSLFQSDRVRKEHRGLPLSHQEVVPYGQGTYRSEMRNRVYAQLLAMAQEQLKSGHSVILDASFSRRKWRDEARQLAGDLDTNVIFVECISKEENIRRRLKEREEASSISDARLQHLPDMIKEFEALSDCTPETHLRADTDLPFPEVLAQLLSEGYAHRCMQVKKILDTKAQCC